MSIEVAGERRTGTRTSVRALGLVLALPSSALAYWNPAGIAYLFDAGVALLVGAIYTFLRWVQARRDPETLALPAPEGGDETQEDEPASREPDAAPPRPEEGGDDP